ncbi:hypothetical protein [Nocardioides dilutus]
MRELLVALLIPAAFVGADGGAAVELTFRDPEIVESSGLALVGDLLVTTNDSGDEGRVFAVDAEGRTVGTSRWSSDPDDVEALAPGVGSSVWVGDIGDNTGNRASIHVASVPVGRGEIDADGPAYDLVYPDGARDAESLLVHPVTGRLYVATKEVFGGVLYAAPKDLDPARPNRLTEVGPVVSIATDAAFFPDGRHLVVRSYENARIYGFPSLEPIADLDLPDQEQGEGVAVTPEGDLLVSTEGQHTDVLRVPLPAEVREAMAPPETAPPSPASTGPPATESREDRELPESTETARSPWPWFLGGVFGLGIIVVLMRSLRRR